LDASNNMFGNALKNIGRHGLTQRCFGLRDQSGFALCDKHLVRHRRT
jgi:hypothetical protein